MSLNRKREKRTRRLIYLPRLEGQTWNRLIRKESLQLRSRASQDRAAEHKGCGVCRLFSGLILVSLLYFAFACLLKVCSHRRIRLIFSFSLFDLLLFGFSYFSFGSQRGKWRNGS